MNIRYIHNKTVHLCLCQLAIDTTHNIYHKNDNPMCEELNRENKKIINRKSICILLRYLNKIFESKIK